MLTHVMGRAAGRVRRLLCGLHGHNALLHFEKTRLSLRCTSCGYETPGWHLPQARPRLRSPQRVVRWPAVGPRRAA